MELDIIVLNDINQTEKDKMSHVLSHTWNTELKQCKKGTGKDGNPQKKRGGKENDDQVNLIKLLHTQL
jgi:hypothetical protein